MPPTFAYGMGWEEKARFCCIGQGFTKNSKLPTKKSAVSECEPYIYLSLSVFVQNLGEFHPSTLFCRGCTMDPSLGCELDMSGSENLFWGAHKKKRGLSPRGRKGGRETHMLAAQKRSDATTLHAMNSAYKKQIISGKKIQKRNVPRGQLFARLAIRAGILAAR